MNHTHYYGFWRADQPLNQWLYTKINKPTRIMLHMPNEAIRMFQTVNNHWKIKWLTCKRAGLSLLIQSNKTCRQNSLKSESDLQKMGLLRQNYWTMLWHGQWGEREKGWNGSYLSFQDLSQHNCAKAIRLGSDEKVLTKWSTLSESSSLWLLASMLDSSRVLKPKTCYHGKHVINLYQSPFL